jgi:hypothetical protein
MSASLDQGVARVLAELTPDERERAVAYLAVEPIDAGARIALPGVQILAETRSLLAFVDQDPAANWGHAARYLLLPCDLDGPAVSIPARLPPFNQKGGPRWQLAFRAATVADSAIAVR